MTNETTFTPSIFDMQTALPRLVEESAELGKAMLALPSGSDERKAAQVRFLALEDKIDDYTVELAKFEDLEKAPEAPIGVNCAGPEPRWLAAAFDREEALSW